MSMFGQPGQSSFTKTVNDLLSLINSPSGALDSLFRHAEEYFVSDPAMLEDMAALELKISEAKESLKDAKRSEKKRLEEDIERDQKAVRKISRQASSSRIDRVNAANSLCDKLLQLLMVPDRSVGNTNGAKILGTILLLSPGEGKGLPDSHQRMKPLYKAVLSVLLLLRLLEQKQITNQYILRHYDADLDFSDPDKLPPFYHMVLVPLVKAAIFQDIGMLHPDAKRILKGEDGAKDEFRLLAPDERIGLLKINHELTLEYLTNGLGQEPYLGKSFDERQKFEKEQDEILIFLRTVINDAVTPKQGLGNLIKAPQIYTSVILSTKRDYDLRELPKAAILLLQIAKKGVISEGAAQALVDILGYFPQGFGLAFIPKDQNGRDMDRYEYAIVNGLYPTPARMPTCRVVTRNQTFISHGQDIHLPEDNNLFFPTTREKLKQVKPERLKEIISKLYHDFDQRCVHDLIPPCWQPYDFFSFKNNQNIWNKMAAKTL